ncbi:MAG: alpha/beta-hydrolase family protein [Pirellulales bacterium]|nr:alpha/beta-hydrolase family protein [Pirellulales bacterium]
MWNLTMRLQNVLARLWASFTYVGLALATLFAAASLTPSLLPRHFAVQGVLCGVSLAAGYGVGVFVVWLWHFMEIPDFGARTQRVSKRITTAAVLVVAVLFLWWATVWQNSIRERMEMPPVETAYPYRLGAIALLVGVTLIIAARGVGAMWRQVNNRIKQVVPRRVSQVVSTVLVIAALFLLANKVVARLALGAADKVFSELDQVIDDGVEQPRLTTASGSAESLVDWNTIGRWGKQFITLGPTRESIAEFSGKDAQAPLRVYVGLGSRSTNADRAKLALNELVRVGGFQRSLLVVATPTGTGWLDPGAVDTLEYLHGGDTAIVSMQYSYLPSWITILVDPARSRDSAAALFDEVYEYWTKLPKESRPKLYVHGLSLGALGSAASTDLFTVFEDPIQGGVWSGPPFPSSVWSKTTHERNPDSPMWLPRVRDGSMLRFTGRECSLQESGNRWGPMRFVFIQHASDPMTFFSPESLYRRPAWLVGERGPDVSPYLQWFPIVTFLQTGFDLPMATSVPFGYGHNYAAESYIDAWVEVTQPPDWDADDTERLKKQFAQE